MDYFDPSDSFRQDLVYLLEMTMEQDLLRPPLERWIKWNFGKNVRDY